MLQLRHARLSAPDPGARIARPQQLLIGAGLAAALIPFAVGVASASSGPTRAFAASNPPATITATRIARPRGTLARGSRVRSAAVDSQRTFLDARHGFALANTGGADYPVATVDGGRTWRTDGPAVHLDAAQAPLAVVDAGAANLHTYFACCGAQVVDATGDGGKHWWRAFIGDVVLAVFTRPNGELITVAQTASSATGSAADTWIYTSRDGGHRWHRDAREGAF